jgi:diguanylate cyclase (GGDEF)-like protein
MDGGVLVPWPWVAVAALAGVGLTAACAVLGAWVVVLRRDRVRDPLTRLYNRVGTLRHVGRALRRREPFVVVFVDLGRFKEVNDQYGHDEGDRVLTEVGRRLRAAFPGRFVARYHGDEFVIVIRPGEVAALDDLLSVIERPMVVGGEVVCLAKAFGVAVARMGESAAELMRRVDLAMYAMKKPGRPVIGSGAPAHEQAGRPA